MSDSLLAVVVLAAGAGTRMRSPGTPKALHRFAGRTLLGHVLAATGELGPANTLVVVGHGRDEVTAQLAKIAPAANPVVQTEQRGTGHAARAALTALAALTPPPSGTAGRDVTVLVVPVDAPLLTAATLARLVADHRASGAAATLLTSVLADPTGYGRVIRTADGTVGRVVEQADAGIDELAVHEVATSVYAFDLTPLREALAQLSTDNAQAEEYLTDVVAILAGTGRAVGAVLAPSSETAGINDRVQLAAAHRAYNARLLEAHMRAGVTIVDPATTWIDAEVVLEPDVTVLPSVDLHGGTRVAAGAVIGPQTSLTDTVVGERSVLERTVARQARVGAGVSIGPFAYLRPGAELADGSHVGTYVEVKNSQVGEGAKVPHLSYVGDATIGAHTNVGAATVFANYDGTAKHRTVVGEHVRIGSDTMLVAPVTVGDGAYTAAGATITKDVPPGALGRSSARQENVAGWVRDKRPGTPAAAAAEATEPGDPPTGPSEDESA